MEMMECQNIFSVRIMKKIMCIYNAKDQYKTV